MQFSFSRVVVVLLAMSTVAVAAEPAASDARRGKTALSKLAAEMKPGTWAELETEMPDRLWNAPPPSKGLHIGTWSDDAHWDSRTGQFLFFGVRQTRKFIAYSEQTNAWRAIDFEGKEDAPEVAQKFGHPYSVNGFDPARGRFYTSLHRYDFASGEWSKLPEPPHIGSAGSMCYEYSSAHDGLLRLARPGTLQLFSERDQKWETLGNIDVHGYHSFARHNPFRDEVLFAGGNDSQAVVILSKDGATKRMKDFPVKLTVRLGVVTVDPASGRYLMVGSDREFFEFDAEKNEYRRIEGELPWGRTTPKAAFIREYGVTMWADEKVLLYKHDAPRPNGN
ncbi:MAG: kelch repeat-containing protein [Planctomycetaceae bacterium]